VKQNRWFQLLLRLLPFDFRTDYGEEMARVFRDERHDARARGRLGVARAWAGLVRSLLAIGPREHAVQIVQDVHYALRGIRRNPGFAAVTVLTLALGIGANTAIFSLVHAVLLRPLPYDRPDELVALWNAWKGTDAGSLSDPEFLDYSEGSRTLNLAAMAATSANVSGGGSDSERVAAGLITVNGLDVLGLRMPLGRGFRPDEERVGQDRVVMLSDSFWRRRYAADPGIVGSRIVVDGVPHEVAGILPPIMLPLDFVADVPVDVLLPLTLDRAAPRNKRSGHYLRAFGRLAPGATRGSAGAEMQNILVPLKREYPDQHTLPEFSIAVRSLRDDLLGSSRDVLRALTGAVVVVLLLACANVANLMLARGEARRRELSVRSALGASRFRVARQLFTESCVLALIGGAAGLLVAFATSRGVLSLSASAFPRMADAGLNLTVLVFAAVLALATGVLFGSIPAFQLSRSDAGAALTEGSRGSTDGRSLMRRALVISQISLALVLVVAAGLLIKSFIRVTRVPSGFDAANVLTLRTTLPPARYQGRPEIAAFYENLLDRVAALPGVRIAGAASGLPLAVSSGDWGFDIEGRPRINGRRPGAADWYVITPGYFEALGIPLVRGRLPAMQDAEEASPVAFVNAMTARTLFPGEDAVGKRIRMSQSTGSPQPWRTIAGIVGDVRQRGLDSAPRMEIYFPYRQFVHFSAGGQARAMSLVVKTDVAPESLAGSVRSQLRSLDPEIPAARLQTMDAVVAASVVDRRLNTLLIGAFGGLALVLAAVGLYGVLAYGVTQRTREIGVRMAIGATQADVLSMIVAQGVRMVAAGLAIGTVAAMWTTNVLTTLLFDVPPRDVTVFATSAVVLLAAGTLAAYIPARRATGVDPVVTLRAE
jgi:putative ABC transport system permease protein